jgi:hypothetical protein
MRRVAVIVYVEEDDPEVGESVWSNLSEHKLHIPDRMPDRTVLDVVARTASLAYQEATGGYRPTSPQEGGR